MRGKPDGGLRRCGGFQAYLHQSILHLRKLLPLTLLAACCTNAATVRYVNLNTTNATAPYTDWSTASVDIQSAIDVASTGDEIVVAPGVYATGSRSHAEWRQDLIRVLVSKAVVVRSLSGPNSTIIEGYQLPGVTNGPGATRCVWLTNGAVLSGFTLTRGATVRDATGAGPQLGGGVACYSQSAIVTNCILVGNSAVGGGGANSGTLYNCVLTGNSSWGEGGGALLSTLNNCLVVGNSAGAGGGVAHNCTLNNCTVTGNSASNGGGADGSTLNNCIVYLNQAGLAGPNYNNSSLNYCCTTPLPGTGSGNLSLDPQFASTFRLAASSPCRGAGKAAYATGMDIDGESWGSPPSIGCEEYPASTVSDPLSVALLPAYTNVATGFAVQLTASINGRSTQSVWDFGDGRSTTNQPLTTHTWETPGDYPVRLTAYNDAAPGGVTATVTVHVETEMHYVAANSTGPVSPYASWATAARDIQSAVDAARLPGAQVVVSNGLYSSGGRVVCGSMYNRLVINKPLLVVSANGPMHTLIQGLIQSANGAMRCVWLTNGAVLSGFTLTQGATQSAGDLEQERSGGGVWCAGSEAVVTNCILTQNSASWRGGGAYGGTVKNCTLIANSAASYGGGAYNALVINSTLVRNSASGGGAVSDGALNNCVVVSNTASSGGGTLWGTLNNCLLAGNSAWDGGGAWDGTLNNCTLTGNWATNTGAGVYYGTLNNCIVYYNQAGLYYPNYSAGSILNYCCTTPLPGAGSGNFSLDPQLVGLFRLAASSPCRSAGNAAYATGVDIDREAWGSPPSIGCDEYRSGALTGPLSVTIQTFSTTVAVGFGLDLSAFIDGRTTVSVWDFGDGQSATNLPYATYTTHAWSSGGDYTVALTAYNDTYPAGVSTSVVVHVVAGAPVHFVNAASSAPAAPYISWATAARTIQDAVDVAVAGDQILVASGIYSGGGRAVYGQMTNRVAVTKPLTVQSVNGPANTFIYGYQVGGSYGDGAIRCVYLTNGAVLSGFTLTKGASRRSGDVDQEESGGGVWCAGASAVVTNCVLRGNMAWEMGGGTYGGTLDNCLLTGNGAYWGAGAYYATLNNCTLTGNSAREEGGGAYGGTLNNCLLTGNQAGEYVNPFCLGGGVSESRLNNCTLTVNTATGYGGGAFNSTLNNCIVYFNNAGMGGANGGGSLNYCCTTPLPSGGKGNFTNEPLFVNLTGGDLHLQVNSPCINAGLNSYAVGPVDLDGRPRIRGGIVDMGAYESATLPQLASLQAPGSDGMALSLSGDPGGVVKIYGSSNLTSWFWLATVTNTGGRMVYTDPGATNQPQRFYKAIQLP